VEVAVSVERLRVVRGGREILRSLTFAVPTGEVVGLLGPSGSGKTTLMRSVVGLQRIAAGTASVLGRPAGAADLRRLVAYVTQAPSVYGDLSVRENLDFFGAILGAGREDEDAALATVGLAGYEGRVVAPLSGGEQARVSLATALLGGPRLLVLDEPTVGLDPVLRRDLWNTFHALAAAGSTLLVSSHVMDEADRCDRLLLLRDGSLLAEETPAGLLARTGARTLDAAFLRLVETEPAP
jgi:ABC-2 type transport system ATP-binding protein